MTHVPLHGSVGKTPRVAVAKTPPVAVAYTPLVAKTKPVAVSKTKPVAVAKTKPVAVAKTPSLAARSLRWKSLPLAAKSGNTEWPPDRVAFLEDRMAKDRRKFPGTYVGTRASPSHASRVLIGVCVDFHFKFKVHILHVGNSIPLIMYFRFQDCVFGHFNYMMNQNTFIVQDHFEINTLKSIL